jgi:hypothetical protein
LRKTKTKTQKFFFEKPSLLQQREREREEGRRLGGEGWKEGRRS